MFTKKCDITWENREGQECTCACVCVHVCAHMYLCLHAWLESVKDLNLFFHSRKSIYNFFKKHRKSSVIMLLRGTVIHAGIRS